MGGAPHEAQAERALRNIGIDRDARALEGVRVRLSRRTRPTAVPTGIWREFEFQGSELVYSDPAVSEAHPHVSASGIGSTTRRRTMWHCWSCSRGCPVR